MRKTVKTLWISFIRIGLIFFMVFPITRSAVPPGNPAQRVRDFTRGLEFDYVNWTINAFQVKNSQKSLRIAPFLPEGKQNDLVLNYLDLVSEIRTTEAVIENIFSHPDIENPEEVAGPFAEKLDLLKNTQTWMGPLSEEILQGQLSAVLVDLQLSMAGQPVPPPLFHMTPLPKALIISPRDTIRQDYNISLDAGLSLEEMIQLENEVEQNLDVSSLVVSIGGVGVYPTMVLSSTDIVWLTEVISHEWIHNFLTLRPLGLNYETSNDLRTINETVANLAGKEIGRIILQRYYPDYLPPPPQPEDEKLSVEILDQVPDPDPPPFSFREEMRITRVTTDQLLAEGRIDQAEAYMEERRKYLWENGYQIRTLNQAYFAFHGAYADAPGGPAGDDPVGEAVRILREQSPSLAHFINRLSWVTSVEQLQNLVKSNS